MQGADLCLVYAPIIAVAVSLAKRIPFVGKNPAVVAGILSMLLNVGGQLIKAGPITTALVGCVLTSLGGAVATHHLITKPAVAITNKVTGS